MIQFSSQKPLFIIPFILMISRKINLNTKYYIVDLLIRKKNVNPFTIWKHN